MSIRTTHDLLSFAKQHGVSQAELAQALGITRQAVTNAKAGRTWKKGIPEHLHERLDAWVERTREAGLGCAEAAAGAGAHELGEHRAVSEREPASFQEKEKKSEKERNGTAGEQETADNGAPDTKDRQAETAEAAVQRLARLSPFDYQRCRKAEARALGVTAAALDAEVSRVQAELNPQDPAAQGAGQPAAAGSSGSLSDEMVSIIRRSAELFHDGEREPYAGIHVDGHCETFPLKGADFREWLAYRTFSELERAPSESAIATALTAASGLAKFQGDERLVHLRAASYEDGILIDLGDPLWRVVHVRPGGWEVLNVPPVLFYRSRMMAPLPIPEPDAGNLDLLWRYANVAEEDRTFALAWMAESLRHNTPFPILELGGHHGRGKSSTQQALRSVVDPSRQPLRSRPKNEEAVTVAARNGLILSYNNLSHLSPVMQDHLCSVATGGGSGARKLYSDSEEVVTGLKRAVVMNGIKTLATAPDLVDRTVRMELPELKVYREERDFWDAFAADHCAIFTGFLDLLARALEHLPAVSLDKPPRMADFAYLGEAVHRAYGASGSFADIYAGKRKAAAVAAVEDHPVVRVLVRYMENRPQTTMTMGNWLDVLSRVRGGSTHGLFPTSGKGLSESLKVVAPGLRAMGLDLEWDPKRHSDGYRLTVSHVQDPAPETGTTHAKNSQPENLRPGKDVHDLHQVHDSGSDHELSEGNEHRNPTLNSAGGSFSRSCTGASGTEVSARSWRVDGKLHHFPRPVTAPQIEAKYPGAEVRPV